MHLNTIRGLALTGIGGATLSLFGIKSPAAAIVSACVFLAGLGLSVLMAFKRSEATWYRARAVAESIKTTAWRFMMRTDPFDAAESLQVRKDFTERLKSILSEHRDLAHDLAGIADNEPQISQFMSTVRDLPLTKRLECYKRERIDEQRRWYSDKALTNKRHGRLWFGMLLTLQSGARRAGMAEPARVLGGS
jgi:hypothetical protein